MEEHGAFLAQFAIGALKELPKQGALDEGATELLRAAQDELVQAGKMAALGQMSAGLAHELGLLRALGRAHRSPLM